ncbi:uncharacterized protein B0P05DRAFT_539428 [Gilbertella persicaria]|uniref:uncharacterized protein n=1 Tax=Gilbertella persicaria TaxID=101096 RepID=UPI00221FBF86|nr:uncharacterized protein B0P05DRAFT_539428 [Gilbertella persicaria]KAI8080747.1 hypothetical protein B0P05DRAFT_539428 [Gilbertella persicaria]
MTRTLPRSRVDDVSTPSRSAHLDLDKDVVFDFGVSVPPSCSGVDSLPEVGNVALLSSVPSVSSLPPSPPAWFAAFQAKFERHEERLAQLESLVAENSALKKELAAARSRILELESQAGSSAASPLDVSMEDDQVAAPSSSVSPSSAGSKWAQVAKRNPTPAEAFGKSKKSDSPSVAKAKPKARITPKQRKAAARIFLVSSPAAAGTCVDRPLYEYVYLPNKYRDRLSAFRRKLRLIGLDNSRVLDVHYPARNVVALLIHSAYKEDLLKVMAKYSLPVLTDFDPFSAANVKDPAFASLDADALSAKARELQQARLVRALGYIREQVRRQVAYDFVRQGWLAKEQAGSVVGSLSAVASAGACASADAPSVPPSSMDFTLAGDGEPVSSS